VNEKNSARRQKRRTGQLEKTSLMRNPTPYLKMRVLGAIDMAEGNSIQARIKAVSQMTFTDEDGQPRQFTWRTIQTWYSRYPKHGVTVMENKPRSDKGKIRKVPLEDVLEAVQKVLPKTHGKTPTSGLALPPVHRAGLLTRSQIAPNTFRRMVKQYELLKPDGRLLQQSPPGLRQGPRQRNVAGRHPLRAARLRSTARRCKPGSSPFLTTLRASAVTASSFLAENVDTLIEALRAAFIQTRRAALALRGQRLHLLLQGNHPNLRPRRLPAGPHAGARWRGQRKSGALFRTVRDQFLARQLDLEFA
jgi:hypothetical protein